MKTLTKYRERLRWWLAARLGRRRSQCWAQLCGWAANGDGWRPDARIDWACHSDAARNGECFCAKVIQLGDRTTVRDDWNLR